MAEEADVSWSGVFLTVLVSAEADLLSAFILCTSSWETVGKHDTVLDQYVF